MERFSAGRRAPPAVEIEEVPVVGQGGEEAVENKVYVAVEKELKQGKCKLQWAVKNFSADALIVLVHVHRPPKRIPIMGAMFPVSQLKEQQVRAYRQLEREKTNESLDEYMQVCQQLKVRAEKLMIEMDDIGKGLVEIVVQHSVTNLVLGAAADKHYSKKLKVLRSKTAIRVKQEAHPSCKIWFVCKGNLIYTRECSADGFGIAESPMSRPGSKAYQQLSSLHQGPGESVSWFANPTKELFGHRPCSGDLYSGGETFLASPLLAPIRISVTLSVEKTDGGKIDAWETNSRRGSRNSQCSSSLGSDEVLCNPDSSLAFTNKDNEDGSLVLQSVSESDEDLQFFSAPNGLAKSSELLYAREVRRRIEIEEELDRIHLDFGTYKNQQDVICEELQKLNEQNSALELQVVDIVDVVKDIEGKLSEIQYSLHSLRENNKVLRGERDNEVRKVRELRRKIEQKLISDGAINFPYFSFSDLQEATRDFAIALKVGKDEFENVYRGWLRNTAVVIKILNRQGLEVLSDFHQELNVLCRVRHPHIVTLLGACPEAFALVYEFLPNGSLEDCLACKRNTPFTWQARTRIASEICSALIFLHSSKPYPMAHGDLKPSNILLDANYVSKLSDTGISHLVDNYVTANSTINTRICGHSHLKDTFTYMDPVFLATGELTPLSDVYSFGVILLHLLTGREMLRIVKTVKEALEKGCLHEIIDPSAGNWPYSHAKQLAQIGLKCCEMNLKNRPDLAGDVRSSLDMMMKPSLMAVPSLSFWSDSEDIQIPSYFICPILQEIMKDPQIAADGFTYEAMALKCWFNSGHDTSPMTNLRLPHCNLVPNNALRLAIREWLQQQA